MVNKHMQLYLFISFSNALADNVYDVQEINYVSFVKLINILTFLTFSITFEEKDNNVRIQINKYQWRSGLTFRQV